MRVPGQDEVTAAGADTPTLPLRPTSVSCLRAFRSRAGRCRSAPLRRVPVTSRCVNRSCSEPATIHHATLGRGAVEGTPTTAMMLHGPAVFDAEPVGQLDLLQGILEEPVLVEDPESHGGPSSALLPGE